MSNDLLFSVLPRNTKVTVKPDSRVKKADLSKQEEKLNHDEKEQHESVHQVDEAAQRALHKRVEEKRDQEQKRQSTPNKATPSSSESATKEDAATRSDDNQAASKMKHLDIYI